MIRIDCEVISMPGGAAFWASLARDLEKLEFLRQSLPRLLTNVA